MMVIPPNLEIEHLIWQQKVAFVAGVDEAGRGPLAGPVVAAAVVFNPYFYLEDVCDSKKLTPEQRENLYPVILENVIDWGVGIVDHREIDEINIRNATFKAMRKAIGSLRVKAPYLLIDGEELPDQIYRQEGIIGGDDKCFTISAASILAKVTRDRLMIDYHQQFPQYRFEQHKGYATAMHLEMLQRYGPCPIHRRSFLKKFFAREEIRKMENSDTKLP